MRRSKLIGRRSASTTSREAVAKAYGNDEAINALEDESAS